MSKIHFLLLSFESASWPVGVGREMLVTNEVKLYAVQVRFKLHLKRGRYLVKPQSTPYQPKCSSQHCTILWAEVLGQAISWRFHLCVTSSSAFLTSGYVLHACHVRAFLSSNKMLLSDLRAKTFGCHRPRVQSTIPEEDMVQIGSCYHFSRGHCLQRRRHRRCAVTSLFEIEVRSCRQLEVTTDNGEAKDAITAMY